MIKSLIKRLKESIGFKKQNPIAICSMDDLAHTFRVPIRVATCPYCSERLLCEIGEKKSGVCGRKIKIACTITCEAWVKQPPTNDAFKRVLKSVLGHISDL